MIMLPPDADILSPIDDHIFKTLLTHPDGKPVLIDVLSSSMDRNVTDAAVRNNELPVSDDKEKGERFDVNCIIGHKDQADVEMHGSHIQETDGGHTRSPFAIIRFTPIGKTISPGPLCERKRGCKSPTRSTSFSLS